MHGPASGLASGPTTLDDLKQLVISGFAGSREDSTLVQTRLQRLEAPPNYDGQPPWILAQVTSNVVQELDFQVANKQIQLFNFPPSMSGPERHALVQSWLDDNDFSGPDNDHAPLQKFNTIGKEGLGRTMLLVFPSTGAKKSCGTRLREAPIPWDDGSDRTVSFRTQDTVHRQLVERQLWEAKATIGLPGTRLDWENRTVTLQNEPIAAYHAASHRVCSVGGRPEAAMLGTEDTQFVPMEGQQRPPRRPKKDTKTDNPNLSADEVAERKAQQKEKKKDKRARQKARKLGAQGFEEAEKGPQAPAGGGTTNTKAGGAKRAADGTPGTGRARRRGKAELVKEEAATASGSAALAGPAAAVPSGGGKKNGEETQTGNAADAGGGDPAEDK
jgi:hypothetical protein